MKHRTRRVLIVTAGVCVATAAIVLWAGHRTPHVAAVAGTPRDWAPLPRDVAIEVLNAGKVPGAARVGTELLRDAGLDVKYFGNADSVYQDIPRNRILVRRGDTVGVGRVIEALGAADVEMAPSEAPQVDLTVLLSRSFRAPAHP